MIDNTRVNSNPKYGICRLSLDGCSHNFHFDIWLLFTFTVIICNKKIVSHFGSSSRLKWVKLILFSGPSLSNQLWDWHHIHLHEEDAQTASQTASLYPYCCYSSSLQCFTIWGLSSYISIGRCRPKTWESMQTKETNRQYMTARWQITEEAAAEGEQWRV